METHVRIYLATENAKYEARTYGYEGNREGLFRIYLI